MANAEAIEAIQSQIAVHQEEITALQEKLSETDSYVAEFYDYRHNSKVLNSLLGDPTPSTYKDIFLVQEKRAEIYKKMYPHKVAIKELNALISQLSGEVSDSGATPVG